MLNQADMIRHLEDARCRRLVVLLSIVLVTFPGCSKRPSPEAREETTATPPAAEPSQAKIDACSLLTSEEIESVQGEAVNGTTPSGGAWSGFPSTQCMFTTVTPVNSVSLVLLQTAVKSPRHVRDFWKETFHREEEQEKEGGKKESEEKKKKSPPQRVADLGEEAFWVGTQISSALYVLKGDSYLRISVGGGGGGDVATKLEKSKKLAQFALKRL